MNNNTPLAQRIEEVMEELRSIWQTTRENEGKYERVKTFFRTSLNQIAEEARKEGYDKGALNQALLDVDVVKEARQAERQVVIKMVEGKIHKLEKASGNQEKGENTKVIGKRIQELNWIINKLKEKK